MLQILLLGLVAVIIYLVSHLIVTKAETWVGVQLGQWRTVLFFVVFLGLMLAAIEILPRFVPAMQEGATP